MNKSVKLTAFGKVNLSLNILGKTESGMHELDSVMMSIDCYDSIVVTERNDRRISVVFDNADIHPENNTAYKAAKSVRDALDCNGWDITVEKGIPIGAGLGGSSADGAAVLRALDVLYKLPSRGVDMRALALGIGSDVPFMLTGGLARVRGTGGDLFFMENKLKVFAVGLMSGFVSTAAAYGAFDALYPSGTCLTTDNDKLCDALLDGSATALDSFANALYAPAITLLPEIKLNARKLMASGAQTVCMTGSGGMVVGYFTDINKFMACADSLRGEPGFKVFSSAPTGILHSHN